MMQVILLEIFCYIDMGNSEYNIVVMGMPQVRLGLKAHEAEGSVARLGSGEAQFFRCAPCMSRRALRIEKGTPLTSSVSNQK